MEHLQDCFDGYNVMTTWQKANGGFIAFLLEFPSVSAYAEEPEDAVKALAEVWKDVKWTFTTKKEEIPVAPSRQELFPADCDGKINGLEIDPQLHYVLSLEARRDNVPLSAIIGRKLKVLADWTLVD